MLILLNIDFTELYSTNRWINTNIRVANLRLVLPVENSDFGVCLYRCVEKYVWSGSYSSLMVSQHLRILLPSLQSPLSH